MGETEKVLKTTETILTMLQLDDGINKYLEKANINIKQKDKDLINKLLALLTDYSLKEDPIGQIIEVLSDIMEDGKIKLNEIIKLMNVLIKNIKNINISNIEVSNEDFALLLKVIIIILDDVKVIDMDKQEETIFDTIDSCVFLIDQFEEIEIGVDTSNSHDDSVTVNNDNNDKNGDNKVEIVDESVSCKCLCFRFKF